MGERRHLNLMRSEAWNARQLATAGIPLASLHHFPHHFLRKHEPTAFDIRHDGIPALESPLQQRQRQPILRVWISPWGQSRV